jgi:hypothetical protein
MLQKGELIVQVRRHGRGRSCVGQQGRERNEQGNHREAGRVGMMLQKGELIVQVRMGGSSTLGVLCEQRCDQGTMLRIRKGYTREPVPVLLHVVWAKIFTAGRLL